MKLHRVGKRADWDKYKSRQRNYWQRLAASTHGIITPGNIISVAGFALVVAGLGYIYHKRIVAGIIAIACGRILDIADGVLADKTGTKSPLGEVVDATIDKIEIAVALPLLVITSVLLPWQAIVLIVQHAANIIFSGISKVRGFLPHASRAGKYATLGQWAAIVLYSALQLRPDVPLLRIISHFVFVLSVIVGFIATWRYGQNALKQIRT